MIMKNILSVFLTAAAISTSIAAAPDWNKPTEFKAANIQHKDGVFTFSGRSVLYSRSAMIVDTAKKYTVKLKMRAVPGTDPALAYAGFQPISKDGHYLLTIHLRQEKNTAAKLLQDAKTGDTQIIISTPARWISSMARNCWYVAMGSDGAPASVPHFDVIRVKDVGEDPEGLAIELVKPLKKDYPAGTNICFHSDGPGMNTIANGVKLTAEWQEFTGSVQGLSDIPGRNAWWKSTHRARLMFMLLPVAGSKNIGMEVKDIVVTEE